MYIDNFLMFSNAQPVANAVGAYDSTNIVDLGLNGLPTSAGGGGARDIGIGDDPALKILVTIVAAIASGGAATLKATLQGAPDNGAGAPGTWYTLGASADVPLAALTQGSRLFNHDMPSIPAGIPVPRFLKMVYTISGAAITAGAVSSGIVLDRYDQIRGTTGADSAYPAGITIAN